MYNAEEYTISVRKERMDEEIYWVARVEELPDIMEFGETRDEAYDLAIDTINTGQEMCLSEGIHFPAPKVFAEANVSGRVTLRLPKSVHANCIKFAEKEGVSLNSYILTCIASYRPLQETMVEMSTFEVARANSISPTTSKSPFDPSRQTALSFSRKSEEFSVKTAYLNITQH
ncbi:toxin-antitoxin system HicB family antitoxin [Citrobacter koseri]|uniref:toxin-antitoxin system HicB family antitoxin n=1 Tax=Citrobacter koseri TaxID=545 RepID=UPI0020056F5B|nr:toxin-antitoxin system HicB family antitoxin [Citrobacter koseri]MCK7562576.1 type II toxin-antitoxin system HicB family antitoxin [Citrobacter koseri]